MGSIPTCANSFFFSLIFTASRVSAILSLSFLLFPALSPFYLHFSPFMEGQWNLVPEQTLLRVEKALGMYLTRAATPSFGSLQLEMENQATVTLSAVQ